MVYFVLERSLEAERKHVICMTLAVGRGQFNVWRRVYNLRLCPSRRYKCRSRHPVRQEPAGTGVQWIRTERNPQRQACEDHEWPDHHARVLVDVLVDVARLRLAPERE